MDLAVLFEQRHQVLQNHSKWGLPDDIVREGK